MIACYILYSSSKNKFYIGATQACVKVRMMKHNSRFYGASYTSFTDDWEIFLVVECQTYLQAINIERHIKRMKSRRYIQNLKRFPETTQKLLKKYKTGT